MKFKEIIDSSLLDDVRNNPNTLGQGVLVANAGTISEDKMLFGEMTIFSLIIQSERYSDAYSQSDSKDPYSIVRTMIEKSKSFLEEDIGEKHGL